MKKTGLLFLLVFFSAALLSAGVLIPQPVSIKDRAGDWTMPAEVVLECDPAFSATAAAVGEWVLECGSKMSQGGAAATLKVVKTDSITEDEAYRLSISESLIVIEASADAGAFYALQSLRFMSNLQQKPVMISAAVINDNPRFSYRGLMLDSSRHFQQIETILRLLDQMALLKLNKFHWHLVDNNGWRIPIAAYPKLTEVGGFLYDTLEEQRNGVYSREEIKAVVEYARNRQIEVIPEIDIPGHSAALLEAYPEFLCPTNREKPPVSQRQGNFEYHEILCVGNPDLYPFLDTVFREIVELFDCKTIHIGGDEVGEGIWGHCPLCSEKMHQLGREKEYGMQKAFLTDICRMLKPMGVKVMNWAERVELGLPEVNIAQIWRGGQRSHLRHAVDQGIPAVSSYGDYAYFDYPDYPGTPKSGWMPVLSMKDVYRYRIVPQTFSEDQRNRVIGGECTLWTEEVLEGGIDAMLFPRLLAFSQKMWSPLKRGGWLAFKRRAAAAKVVLENRGIQFSREPDRNNLLAADVKVEAPLHARATWPEYGVDGSDVTAYVSSGNISVGDSYTLTLGKPKAVDRLEVITGGYFVWDAKNSWMNGAVVEVASDGVNFREVGTLKRGQLAAELQGAMIKAVRIRAVTSEKFPMVVNEIRLK